MKMKFKVATVAAVSVAALTAPVLARHAWSTYHWSKASNTQVNAPIVTAITDSVWGRFVDQAVVDWNASEMIEAPYDPKTNSPAAGVNPKTCKAITGKILVCNAKYGFTGWLGVAQIWLSGGHIVKGITKLNDSYFNTTTYNKDEWRALVTCQEIGHDYGLGHQDEDFENPDVTDLAGKETCMDYTDRPLGNEHPNQHDYDQLVDIYTHGDDSSALTASGPGKSGASASGFGGDTPADWGRAVDRDAQGRPHYFVQDLGGGNRKITHVFWAIGEGPGGRQHDDH